MFVARNSTTSVYRAVAEVEVEVEVEVRVEAETEAKAEAEAEAEVVETSTLVLCAPTWREKTPATGNRSNAVLQRGVFISIPKRYFVSERRSTFPCASVIPGLLINVIFITAKRTLPN